MKKYSMEVDALGRRSVAPLKSPNYTPLWLVAIIFTGICGFCSGRLTLRTYPANVNLPEEYRLITLKDRLIGSYDSASNTLSIEFDNDKNK